MSKIKTVLKEFIIGLAHVGHIVENREAALENFKRVYGVTDADIRIPPDPPGELQTKFAFVSVQGVEFELIEPVSAFFNKLLWEMPSGLGGINHVAYQVDDIDAAAAALAAQHIRPGHVTPNGVVDFGPKKILYLDPADTGGLVIELIELKSP